LGTSAWNTLLVGKKRWILFPPTVPKSIVKGNEVLERHEDDEPVHYFTTIFPRIKQRATEIGKLMHPNGVSCNVASLEQWKKFTCCYEFTQMTGDTVFIPNGWWHAVLNLSHTVAVTQNFCSAANFDSVWLKTRADRKKMAAKWLVQLEKHFPHLAKRAIELNQRDKFIMTYNPSSLKDHTSNSEKKHNHRRKKDKRKHKEINGDLLVINGDIGEHDKRNISSHH
jgi:histone arginine demethylase JMJD6